MKKVILFATMFVLSLVLMACGNESTSSESDDSSNSENKLVRKIIDWICSIS